METNSEFKIVLENENQDVVTTELQSETNLEQNEIETTAIGSLQYKMYLKREEMEHSEQNQKIFMDAWNKCTLYMKEVLKYGLLKGMEDNSDNS